jgi:hypothetical protein
MALLSFRGISTPSLMAQGEQRRSSNFNIRRGNPRKRWVDRFKRVTNSRTSQRGAIGNAERQRNRAEEKLSVATATASIAV